MLNSLWKRGASNTLCTVRRCLPLKYFHTLVAMAREKKKKKIPVANTFIIPKSSFSRAVCLITHKKYCGFFRGLRGNFSTATSCPAQLIADAAEGQPWPAGVTWWWLIFRDPQEKRGCSPGRADRWDGAGLLPAAAVAWEDRATAPAPCASSTNRRRRDGSSTFFSLRMSFLAASYSGKGSPSPHGSWLPGRLKMPPLSHHLSQTRAVPSVLGSSSHPFWHPNGPEYPYVMLGTNTQDFPKLWALHWNWGNIFI